MTYRYRIFAIASAAAALILVVSLFLSHLLWKALLNYHTSQLGHQINATLYNDVSEGNLFSVSATLGRLRMAGIVSEAGLFQILPSSAESSVSAENKSIDSNKIYWLYSSNPEMESSLGSPAAIANSCRSTSSYLLAMDSHTVRFLVRLFTPEGNGPLACVIAESQLPPDLIKLRSFVWFTLAIVIVLSIGGITTLLLRMQRQQLEFKEAESMHKLANAKALADLASQVAHDIRSPLSALNMIIASSTELPEEKSALIRGVAKRINDIANDLLKSARRESDRVIDDVRPMQPGPPSLELLDQPENHRGARKFPLVLALDNVIKEKQFQYSNTRPSLSIQIKSHLENGFALFAEINPADLYRVLSNLLNNAIEASINSKHPISVELAKASDFAEIKIVDKGIGIPQHILNRLGERGVSFGKGNDRDGSGSGLGIFHAKNYLHQMGGRLLILSEEGIGTTVTLLLPLCSPPSWACLSVEIPANYGVACIDDDESVHQIWSQRLAKLEKRPEFHLFTSFSAASKWISENQDKATRTKFFVDLTIRQENIDGISFITSHHLEDRAVLVSSHEIDQTLESRLNNFSVPFLPKSLATIVPLDLNHH